MDGMQKVVGLVNRLQQICSSLGETALSANAVLWNKLPTIVVVGGQVRLIPQSVSVEHQDAHAASRRLGMHRFDIN